jgi:hypothetical protein
MIAGIVDVGVNVGLGVRVGFGKGVVVAVGLVVLAEFGSVGDGGSWVKVMIEFEASPGVEEGEMMGLEPISAIAGITDSI